MWHACRRMMVWYDGMVRTGSKGVRKYPLASTGYGT